jgi:signal transduction histidine kinase/sensor domain CHASE-containing protein
MAKKTIVQTERGTKRSAVWLACVVGTVMAAAVLALWYVIDQRAHEHAGSSTDHSIHMNELLIQQDAENRLLALDRLAHRMMRTSEPSQADWESDAVRYLDDMPGFIAIQWIDAGGHARWQVHKSLEAAPTPALAELAAIQDALERSRHSGDRQLSDVFVDPQGNLCIAVVVPVIHHDAFDGVIAGFLNPDEWLMSVIGRLQGSDHHVEVLLEGHPVFRHDAPNDVPDDNLTLTHPFSAGGLNWQMRVTPTTSFLSTGHADSSSLVLIVGLMLSALTAVAVYFGLAARDRSHQYHDIALQMTTLFRNLPGMAYRRRQGDKAPMAFVSEGCRALSGYPQKAFADGERDWLDLVHRDDRGRVMSNIKKAFTDGEPFEVSYRITDAHGKTRWMWERGRVIPSEVNHDVHLEGFVTDISEQRSAESEAREHREHLAHVDRLNMLGEMATGIAHEINQPLSAITILVQAGDHLIRTERYGRLSEILQKLVRHAHRASAVIDRMQQMAKRHESIKETRDCKELIKGVTRLAEAEARMRDIEIETHTETGLPAVSVDEVQIQQVALNLLRNGMDAMESIDCGNGNTISLYARLCDDGTVEVSVVDQGRGVPDSVSETLFAPFSTTKKSGMGMGLSISRAIIMAHGGNLSFRNNSDVGATFFFTLPPAEQEGKP